MKKMFQLIRVQIWTVLRDIFSMGIISKKRPELIYIGVIIFSLAMSGLSFFYSLMLGTALKMYQSLEILPSMMMAATCIAIFMTTIFKVKGTIFGLRDYDLVMSLPVSTGVIVACRVLILYILNFLFVIIINVPMMLAYGILARPSVLFYLLCFVAILFMPLIPIVIASVFGTFITYVSSKLRRTNFLKIITNMGFLIFIIGMSFIIQENSEELVELGTAIFEKVNTVYPLASLYQKAVVHYDMVAFILFIGISMIVFAVYVLVVKRMFKKINTLIMTGVYRVNYKLGELKTASPLLALYKKEIKRYFSSSLYVLNTGFGIVSLTIVAIASIFVDLNKIFGDPHFKVLLSNYIPLFITFCIVMTYTAASSLSLEGKSLWILKSVPVDPKTIYLAKIGLNLTIIAPAFIDAIILGIVLHLGILKILLSLLVIVASAFFTAFLGLLVNILIPNFQWTSETIVVKQSAASTISVFAGMGFTGVLFLFISVIPSYIGAYIGYFLFTVVIDIALYALIMSYGRKRFYKF